MPKHVLIPTVISVVVVGVLTVVVWQLAPEHWWLGGLFGVNLATFGQYAYDKRAAQRDDWRIPEAVLHGHALLGGSPAALLAQQTLRHKTRKTSFQFVFWLIVALQAGAWWFFDRTA